MVIHITELMMGLCEVWIKFEGVPVIRHGSLIRPIIRARPQQEPARYVGLRKVGIERQGLLYGGCRFLHPLFWLFRLNAECSDSICGCQGSVTACELRINFHRLFKKPDGLVVGLPRLQTVIRLR